MLYTYFVERQKGFFTLATATLVNGVNRLTVEIDGDDECGTLDRLFELYAESVNIPEDATVAVNGDIVDPEDFSETALNDGDVVSATKTAGSKG